MSKQTPDEMLAEIESLRKKLDIANTARTEAEELAHAMAAASPFVQSSAEEQPTGKTIKYRECLNPHVRDAKLLKFKEVDIPTYYYTIQLPPGAGICLATNGLEYYHGQTYEFDAHQLAEMKSRVARCWDHEKSIHGDNENAYRKPTNRHFKSAAVR